MKLVNKLLEEYVNQNIIPKYKEFDKGHDVGHVSDVIQNSLEIAESLDVDIDMVFVIAAYHDVGIVFGRENHNITSGKLMIEDAELKRWFSEEQLIIMQQAIEDHRASNDYEPRTIYGKIISEADRVIDAQTIIFRTIGYGKTYYPEFSAEQHFERTYQHIQQKYGENGYLKLWLNTTKNTEGLRSIRELLADKEKMRKMFDDFYKAN